MARTAEVPQCPSQEGPCGPGVNHNAALDSGPGANKPRLVCPCIGYESTFRAMAEEFQAAGELHYSSCLGQIREDFPAFVKSVLNMQNPRRVAPGRVPQTEFWLVEEAEKTVLGTIRFRHALTPALEACGGHIGYAIRPSERRKGYGKLILALLLDCLRASGWEQVLITCDAQNSASARVIEANGGRLEDQRPYGTSGKLVSRYWIDLEGF